MAETVKKRFSQWDRPVRCLIVACSVIVICGCTPAAVDPASEDTEQEIAAPVILNETWPTFSANSDAMMAAMRDGTSRWKDVVSAGSTADSYSGGSSEMFAGANGSISIYTAADGRVWRLRVGAGMGERCHDDSDAQDMIAGVLKAARVEPPPQSDIDLMKDALASDSNQIANGPGYRLNASGGCVDTVTITAE